MFNDYTLGNICDNLKNEDFFLDIFNDRNVIDCSEENNSLDLCIKDIIHKDQIISIENRESRGYNKDFYSIYSIKEILRKYIKDPNLLNKLNKENSIEYSSQYKFINTQKKSRTKLETKDSTRQVYLIKKRIKIKKDKEKKTHDKMSPDNILKKIKSNLLNKYILYFLNNILNLEGNNISNKLNKLDYELYINQFLRETELSYLQMTLKELFSLNITKKYKYLKENHNKSILENIKETETIKFVLNLTLNDFIDLFTHKKGIEEIKYNEVRDNSIIEKNLPGVEKFFIDLLEKTDDIEYTLLVIFYLYNLERSIRLKQVRRKKKIKFILI